MGISKLPSILIVDDSPQNVKVLDTLLNRDYIVKVALTGEKALKKVKSGAPPDLILLDVIMPGIDGYEVCKKLKADPELKDIPVIFMTALDKPADEIKGFEVGAVDYIVKPFNPLTIKARVQTHIKLRKAHQLIKEQRDHLQEINQKLEQAKQIALDATNAKSTFLANMSHEIRTPMNGVIAATDLALGEHAEPRMKRFLKLIHSSANSLLDILNDILDFSKIEAGKIELEETPFHLEDVITHVTDLFLFKAAEKKIDLLLDLPPQIPKAIIGDALRLQQILTNLMGNAVKFSSKGGMIVLAVKDLQKDADRVKYEFSIKDTGIGLNPEQCVKLFQPFSQADASTTRKFGGTGLGLCICKQLVEMMDGQIAVESKPNIGSRFYFTCWFKLQNAHQEESLIMPRAFTNLNVLIVDDAQESIDVVQRLLESFQVKVTSVRLGSEALRLLKNNHKRPIPFGLILLDWYMPEMDGFQVAEKIRGELKLSLPIIMMTALGMDSQRQKAKMAGIDAFLIKPICPAALFETILKVFGQTRCRSPHSPPIKTSPKRIDPNRFKGLHILVAEDNPTNQQVIQSILENVQIKVTLVNSGQQAVAMIQKNTFDGVLMDIQMPEMDGFQATSTIRKLASHQRLPIIALTANAMKGDKEKCLEAGMDDYVSKPILQENLFQTLAKWVPPSKGTLTAADMAGTTAPPHHQETETLPYELPGIHYQEAMQATGLNLEVYKDILLKFLRNNQNTTFQIREAFEKKEWRRLKEMAHSIKGAGANIGAYPLQKTAQKLETACQAEQPDNQMVEHVTQALGQVLDSIKTLHNHNQSGLLLSHPQKADPEELQPIFQYLLNAIEDCDPAAIQTGLNKLVLHIGPRTIRPLEEQLENYEYDDAVISLKAIATKCLFKVGHNH